MSVGKRIQMILLDLVDLVSFLVFVTGVVLFIRFFVINPYTVIGASMEPTFDERDFIIVDKITPRWGEIQRGDIIVFVPHGKDLPFIKRVVGLPGEKILIEDGQVYVCDMEDVCEVVNESAYIPAGWQTTTDACGRDEFVVEDDGYFVLGDNRDHSTDSRCCFGLTCYEDANYLVYPEDMIGKVMLRLYPSFEKFW